MNDFPDNKDRLFIEEIDPINGAWLQNPTDKFFLYSEGYKSGADTLYDNFKERAFYGQWLIYPMIFNYRQYVELRLKELIIMGYKYLDVEDDFKDIHDLTKLWNTYRYEVLINIHGEEPELLDNVERLVNEFNTTDPGFSFRYPVTRGPNRRDSITMNTVDLHNFKRTIDKISRFFEYQWEMMSNYQDLKAEFIAQVMSEMYRENGYY